MVHGTDNEAFRKSVVQWYALGMRYIRSKKVAEKMQPEGFECFVPPVVTNLLFVRSTESELTGYLWNAPFMHRPYLLRRRSDWTPLVIRDKEMEDFILVCENAGSEMPIVLRERPQLKLGDRVRITDGPMKGVEGNIVRIRKQKRVLLNVGDVLWAATTYIPPELLELVEN